MEGIKAELEKLHEMIKKLEKGELEVSELLYLEDAARALYEKSIILKFKAFENRSAVSMNMAPSSEELEVSTEDIKEDTGFDFGIFDEPEISAPHEEIPVETNVVSEEETILPSSQIESDIEEHVSISETESAQDEEVIKEVRVEHTVSSIAEPKLQSDNSLAGRLAGGKLTSLIGAFGLNQRLQFINELFDGSSEDFSEAIKSLDTQSDLHSAKVKLGEYAARFNWDPKDETVLEFVSFVNRRHA